MTDNPTPPSSDEQLPQVGWWCWRGDNHGHLATQPCRSDNVPIHVPAEWADEMREVIQRIEDGDEDEQPAASVSAVDQTTRDRIAEAPAVWIDGHPQLEAIAAAVWERCRTEDTSLVVDDPRNIAVAAFAAMLPPNADRAAELVKQIGLRDYWHQEAMSATARIIELETKLRRMAVEAQQPAVGARQPDTETPGCPDPRPEAPQ